MQRRRQAVRASIASRCATTSSRCATTSSRCLRKSVIALGALVALVALASCWRNTEPKNPDEQMQTEAQKTVQRDQWERESDAHPPPPNPPVASPPGTYVIAGCNTACNGCSIGKSTSVHGVDVATGKELFPKVVTSGGGGVSCSAYLPLDTHVQLIAKSGDGLVLDKWRAFNADDYCPCAGTDRPICDVTITKEIAAKFTRAYCGADWKAQGAAQIGH
ncbi:MAG TPA: hypothetical protein VMZ53_16535 [Kofleriaceae bacterium]|nr:hypothetical protein [Kofleriaceae bacterium]